MLTSVGQADNFRTRLADEVGVTGMSPHALRSRLVPSNENLPRAYASFASTLEGRIPVRAVLGARAARALKGGVPQESVKCA